MVDFQVTATDGDTRARTGRLTLRSGTVRTPVFMPVGSRATVRGLAVDRLRECGAEMLLANAYHLALRPGAEVVAQAGGLHRFMAWDGPILTDSGGYQVFSLAEHREITDDGVAFRSPVDGSEIFLGPRKCMRVQNLLDADVAMVLDQCPPYPCEREVAEEAVRRTLRWAEGCKRWHENEGQALFGIVQGSVFEDLRERSARETLGIGFDGYAIGGVSVGEDEEMRRRISAFTAGLLPEGRPRYLMGVGFPVDLLEAVAAGVDMFDCVAPTRMGRNATAFTAEGRLRMRNSAFRTDQRPVEPGCECLCCRLYSRAHVHHLFKVGEMLGPILLSVHNLKFYSRLLEQSRQAVVEGSFARFKDRFTAEYLSGERQT